MPPFTGTRTVEPTLAELVPYIDWQFFFHAWDLKGKFPAILEQPGGARALRRRAGAARRDRARRARCTRGACTASGPRTPRATTSSLGRHALLLPAPAGGPRRRPAEPLASPTTSRRQATTSARSRSSIHGADELAARYEAEHDDYRAIIVKALADRLAEAFAEWLHERARREWYAPDEHLREDDLLAERFRGIRPAFGYPACPDHSEKPKLFDLLGAGAAGIELTESFAMTPGRRRQRPLLRTPAVAYFAVGRIGRDQLEDYAERKGAPARGRRALARARASCLGRSGAVGYPGRRGRPHGRRRVSMRTTLKRGVGRGAAASTGTAMRVFPPGPLSTGHPLPRSRRRAGGRRRSGSVGRILIVTLLVVMLARRSPSRAAAYLYFHQSVAAVRAHTPSTS